ncbi:MAG: hypothetical protein JO115_11920 [Pseudonocardiales bacterium]|nr:hypothetical protein [Pseudonocardiales bacterium]
MPGKKAGQSAKAQRDQFRDHLRELGCSIPQIAAEMGRRFNLRPRLAWRLALDWPQWKVAQHYNTIHPGSKLSDHRVSDYENWPHGGAPPSPRYLARLAATYGHGCTVSQLVDAADLEQLTLAERHLLTASPIGPTPALITTGTARPAPGDRADPDRAPDYRGGDTVVIRGSRRIVRYDARGLPIREEVIVAAEESAQFRRWSAITNVDDDVLEQMTLDVAELARREQIDPPATMFSHLLNARDDVFALITGRQQPRHTTSLYKIAGQTCALLALATFDLGYPHAATTHARTALHCAETAGYTPLRAFIRVYVQSNIAYWDGRYDEAAALVESALPDATSGTTLLLLASQQARVHAARRQPGDVTRALALAASAPTERTVDEPGTFGFDTGSAALCASEAHYALGDTDNLDAAVDWARTALEEFSAEAQPKAMYIAAARFDLALAHLGRGELDAVSEHLAPVLHSTQAEYRTVPIIGRARSLHTLLTQRPDLASSTLTTLNEDLAEFCTHPAPTPPGLEPEAAT